MPEVISVLKRVESKDSLQWNHTSASMSLFANANSAKGKSFKPADFNPYNAKGRDKEIRTKEEALAFIKSIGSINGTVDN